jgi:hypothetical protein
MIFFIDTVIDLCSCRETLLKGNATVDLLVLTSFPSYKTSLPKEVSRTKPSLQLVFPAPRTDITTLILCVLNYSIAEI